MLGHWWLGHWWSLVWLCGSPGGEQEPVTTMPRVYLEKLNHQPEHDILIGWKVVDPSSWVVK